MDKANVIKSKSSNSAITTKSDSHSNKKSRSNAEFQRSVVKKRGVYVEKKATNISIHNTGNLQNNSVAPNNTPAAAAPKAPPRPKAGQKRFLASVLTILSKSTAATQFPENGPNAPKPKTKRKTETARQKKYRSKVLNDEMIKNLDQKSLVLQYKNINNTPSNFSDTDSFKHRELYSPKSNRSNLLKSDMVSVISSEAKGVVKQVLEGLQAKNKDVRIQEPVTEVEKITKTKQKSENDEQLYKFFVDLLETTFSVYNVKADYDAAPDIESGFSSKVAFEIDESVVKKLETKNEDDDETQKHNYYYVKDTDVLGGNNNLVPDLRKKTKEPIKEVNEKPAHPRRLKAQSFIYNPKPKNSFNANNFEPLVFPKKTISKKAKKKTLINLFKEQLKMSYSDYEEPQTLFEALRVMARNKRKYKKSIHFDVPSTKECVFRRPKIISTKKSKNNTKYDYEYDRNMQPSNSYNKSHALSKPVEKDSFQTLEVYGYDYEVSNDDPAISVDKDTMLQSFPSDDGFEFDNFASFHNYVTTRDEINKFDQGKR